MPDEPRRPDPSAEWAAWSDNEISRQCKVSDHLVATLRKQLAPVHHREFEDKRTVSRGGTTYTQNTAAIGRAAWSDREIAGQCKVSDMFVGKLRDQLAPVHHQTFEDRPRTVSRGGTTYTQNTAAISPHRSRLPAW
jgi:hypothetical protein